MKIVKQFDDPDYFKRGHYLALEEDELARGMWRWGLGDDGNLYWQSTARQNPSDWYEWEGKMGVSKISFKGMLRIAKEFGHLVAFI